MPTDDGDLVQEVALELLNQQVGRGRRFRLVGVGVSTLTPPETFGQLKLFDQPSQQGPTSAEPATRGSALELTNALREVRDRFGENAVRWANDTQ